MAVDLTEASQYGVGKSDAFVWGQNRSLQGLERAYQQEQLRKQKEEAELADQLAKVNTDGVRDADLDPVMKRYDELKNTFAKIRGTRDQMERIKLQAQLNQQKTELSRAVSISKAAAQQEADLGKIPLTNPDNISDDFVPSYSKLRTLSVFDPNYKTQAEYITANGVLPKFDNNAYSKVLLDRSVENVQGAEQRKKDGRLNYVIREEGSKLNEANILKNAAQAYTTDRRFQKFIDREYAGMKPQEAITRYSKDLFEANRDAYNKVKEKNVRQFTDEAPDRFYAHWNYMRDNPVGVSYGAPIKKEFYTAPDQNNRQKKVFDVENFVSVNPTAIGLPQVQNVYDVQQGKNVNLPATASVEITGIGHIPVEGGKKQLRVFLTDKDGAEYSMIEEEVPAKTRADKGYQAAKQEAIREFNRKNKTAKPTAVSGPSKKQGKKQIKGF